MAVDLETVLYRSKLTAQFLASDAWTEAEEAVEQAIKDEWARFDTPSPRRDELWAEYQAFQRLKTRFRAMRDRALDETSEE